MVLYCLQNLVFLKRANSALSILCSDLKLSYFFKLVTGYLSPMLLSAELIATHRTFFKIATQIPFLLWFYLHFFRTSRFAPGFILKFSSQYPLLISMQLIKEPSLTSTWFISMHFRFSNIIIQKTNHLSGLPSMWIKF